jgi:hypothetical protein
VRSTFIIFLVLLFVTLSHRSDAQTPSSNGVSTATSEPSYEGRPLREWVAQLNDRVPEVRIRAAYALAGIGPAAASAVPALRTALVDEFPVVRYAAAWALGEIGPAARVALPDLETRAEEDRVGDVRWVAAKSMRKLLATR